MTIHDYDQRQAALNPEASFIVQAPAGSGKTELLTQRLLVLLAHTVETPEEVVALTFTRKAAREMRDRVLEALTLATETQEPTEPHKQHTWKLARAVLEKDQQADWNILSNPNRLNIMTIDSLTATINKKTPLLSQVGSQPQLVDNATLYFESAAIGLLDTLQDTDSAISQALQTILLHCDNKAATVIQLFAQLLNKRQQWLPTVMQSQQDDERIQHLEQTLQAMNLDAMQRVLDHCDPSLLHPLMIQAETAATILVSENPEHAMRHLIEDDQPLSATLEQRNKWIQLAQCVLTSQGQWRKSLTKRQGFTAKSEHKVAMQALLDQCRNNTALESAFHDILHCPPIHYNREQCHILQALLNALPHLAAHLTLVFQQHNVIDFAELTLAALRALGSPEQPTDLALYLDDRITHLLVDEFQDTSIAQYHLLQRLTFDWHTGDGRTVFFVGDPMQSIYRFRNAEVTLFMQAQTQGFGSVDLTPLQLTMNFRSKQGVVDWVNTTFASVFPDTIDLAYGGVPLSQAISKDESDDTCVNTYACLSDDSNTQGDHIAKTIQSLQSKDPNGSVAILVRSRNHLRDILPALSQHAIAIHATDIDPLNIQAEIVDTLTLCRALLSTNDRIAWMALLRSPLCGCDLKDVWVLSRTQPHQTLWQRMQDDTVTDTLTDAGQVIVRRIRPILIAANNQKGRVPFHHRLKFTWLALGGPQCLQDTHAQSHCDTLFDLIAHLEQEESTLRWETLQERVDSLFAEPHAHGEQAVNIMTIHKSKGLEFDHVILPHLESGSANASPELLKWQEHIDQHQQTGLVMAPIKASTQTTDPIYDAINRYESKKSLYERQRLLYVAVTRAKTSLHVFATVDVNDDDTLKSPRNNSALQLLWPLHETTFDQSRCTASTAHHSIDEEGHSSQDKSYRLPTDWRPQSDHPYHLIAPNIKPYALQDKRQQAPIMTLDTYQWQRALGITLHAELERISIHQSTVCMTSTSTRVKRSLQQQGVDPASVIKATESILKCLSELQQDSRAQWLLWEKHPQAYSEYAITTIVNGTVESLIIDRFIIDSHDQLWIIDYKTSQPGKGQTPQAFMEEKQREYSKQLDGYAKAIQANYQQPIQLALYFPLIQGWHTWIYTQHTSTAEI